MSQINKQMERISENSEDKHSKQPPANEYNEILTKSEQEFEIRWYENKTSDNDLSINNFERLQILGSGGFGVVVLFLFNFPYL